MGRSGLGELPPSIRRRRSAVNNGTRAKRRLVASSYLLPPLLSVWIRPSSLSTYPSTTVGFDPRGRREIKVVVEASGGQKGSHVRGWSTNWGNILTREIQIMHADSEGSGDIGRVSRALRCWPTPRANHGVWQAGAQPSGGRIPDQRLPLPKKKSTAKRFLPK